MLGIVVALYALHSYRIEYQPLSPKPIPRRLFKLVGMGFVREKVRK
jgi:hypothetical protein